MTITEFLLARIAEDEDERNVDLRPWPYDYSSHDRAEAARWKAECEASTTATPATPCAHWRRRMPITRTGARSGGSSATRRTAVLA